LVCNHAYFGASYIKLYEYTYTILVSSKRHKSISPKLILIVADIKMV